MYSGCFPVIIPANRKQIVMQIRLSLFRHGRLELNDSGKMEMNRTIPEGPWFIKWRLWSATWTAVIQMCRFSLYGNRWYSFPFIPEATYLTQQMGSTGLKCFCWIRFEILPRYRCTFVRYDFEEGDHAQPVVLPRTALRMNRFSEHHPDFPDCIKHFPGVS